MLLIGGLGGGYPKYPIPGSSGRQGQCWEVTVKQSNTGRKADFKQFALWEERPTLTFKYECIRTWNSKVASPSLCTCSCVSRAFSVRVTVYRRPNSYGQASRNSWLNIELVRPKSSFTASPVPLGVRSSDSDEDFPRNSQCELRAKPCCGRECVA